MLVFCYGVVFVFKGFVCVCCGFFLMFFARCFFSCNVDLPKSNQLGDVCVYLYYLLRAKIPCLKKQDSQCYFMFDNLCWDV